MDLDTHIFAQAPVPPHTKINRPQRRRPHPKPRHYADALALTEIERTTGEVLALDDVPHDDPATFRLIRSAHTIGCFQIESPGQRELIGRFAPQSFSDLIIDISLFRPGPVKSDMVTPFLAARQGWAPVTVLHESLRGVLASTCGVVVFHEQVIAIIAITAGVDLTQAESARRAMGSPTGQEEVATWWRPLAQARGYTETEITRIWDVLAAFASFGFCRAHAAAFALPTYQSAWLKAHHPAAFLAGVLTHDPGMYPARLLLEEARRLGITVLGVDVNTSRQTYRAEWIADADLPGDGIPELVTDLPPRWGGRLGHDDGPGEPDPPEAGYRLDSGVPDARGWGIRLSLADVKGISADEVDRITAGAPYVSLADLWHRARPTRPIAERLVEVGALDAVHGLTHHTDNRTGLDSSGLGSWGVPTRRDLLLQVADLDRWTRAQTRPPRRSPTRGSTRSSARTSVQPDQLTLDLTDAPDHALAAGLPEMTGAERVRTELEILGLDASAHVLDDHAPLLDALAVTRSRDLLHARNRADLLVAGVKVATQTPPIRSGRRVVFLTLDDATGLVDATFFEDAQGPWAATVFSSWLLLVRGELRRTGPRGVSLRATGAWDLTRIHQLWRQDGTDAVTALITTAQAPRETVAPGVQPQRVLRHASGFLQSPYSDIAPAGGDVTDTRARLADAARQSQAGRDDQPPRKVWHSSPGSSGS